jgi:effector-binding domain-containing protein
MEQFAKKRGFEFTGPVYNIYLFDDISMADPDQYLLQASVPVRELRHSPTRRLHRHF